MQARGSVLSLSASVIGIGSGAVGIWWGTAVLRRMERFFGGCGVGVTKMRLAFGSHKQLMLLKSRDPDRIMVSLGRSPGILYLSSLHSESFSFGLLGVTTESLRKFKAVRNR